MHTILFAVSIETVLNSPYGGFIARAVVKHGDLKLPFFCIHRSDIVGHNKSDGFVVVVERYRYPTKIRSLNKCPEDVAIHVGSVVITKIFGLILNPLSKERPESDGLSDGGEALDGHALIFMIVNVAV